MSVKISVCIAATRPQTIGAAVRSIVSQTFTDWELIVVAQGSAVEAISVEVRAALGSHRGRIVPDEGHGLSRARNVAIAASSGRLIAMTDDDCEAAADWLDVLVSAFDRDPRVGLIGGTVIAPPKGRSGVGNCPETVPLDTTYDSSLLGHDPPDGFGWIGANFAFRRTAYESVGPFDERLGAGTRYGAGEDIDFQYRAVEARLVMQSVSASIVRHTYGWRYGIRELERFQRNYALGGGAFGAKLELMGDPFGQKVLEHNRELLRRACRRGNPLSIAIATRRYWYARTGYRECLARFDVDGQGLLCEREVA